MPIIKSAIKRMRADRTKTVHNLRLKRSAKESVKQVRDAIAAGNTKDLGDLHKEAQKRVDMAVKHNIYHRNKGARIKARLNTAVKAATAEKPAAKKPAAKKPAAKKKAA